MIPILDEVRALEGAAGIGSIVENVAPMDPKDQSADDRVLMIPDTVLLDAHRGWMREARNYQLSYRLVRCQDGVGTR